MKTFSSFAAYYSAELNFNDAWYEKCNELDYSIMIANDGSVSSKLSATVSESNFNKLELMDPVQIDTSTEVLDPVEGELK